MGSVELLPCRMSVKSSKILISVVLVLTSFSLLFFINVHEFHLNDCKTKHGNKFQALSLYSNPTFLSEDQIIQRTSICSNYFQFLEETFPKRVQEKENNYPLAFAIPTHQFVGILELFLASSFHPLDSYCIHVDAKAHEKVKMAVSQIVKCYQWKYPKATIFTLDNPIEVVWGTYSVIEADFKCMEALRGKNDQWKVLINPAATELPLKPMADIRKMLSSFPNGIVDSHAVPKNENHRFEFSIELKRSGKKELCPKIVKTSKRKSPPPRGIIVRKGSKNVALTRELVNFSLDNSYSKELQEWLQDARHSSEHFYATIITIFHTGTQDLETDFTYGGCVRLSWWHDNNCRGKLVRNICNFGVNDLPRLHDEKKCLFANKFNLEVDPIAPIMHTHYVMYGK